VATNQQSQEQRKAIEDAATSILAHLDMGNSDEVERLLYTPDRHSLGLIIATWFHICIAYRGPKLTTLASGKTMEYLNAQAKLEDRPEEEAAADRFAASLLFHLNDNAMDRYAKAWDKTVKYAPDISADVAARMLGFVRGMVHDVPEPDAN
jgi:hypothetical protein